MFEDGKKNSKNFQRKNDLIKIEVALELFRA